VAWAVVKVAKITKVVLIMTAVKPRGAMSRMIRVKAPFVPETKRLRIKAVRGARSIALFLRFVGYFLP
jgi:hypothetical protein